ncbi:MAG TPA: hypothetical protein VHG08_21590 [Longimicrobium sp.]|nr:hypothetical protein [Longimicrobium sp.]
MADESASRKGSPAAGAVSRTRSARRRRGRARNPFRRFFLRLRGAREALLWSVILLVLAQKFNVEAVAQEHGIANADELLVATPLVLFGLGEIWDFVSGKLLEYLGVGTMFVLGLGKLLGGSSAAVPVPVEYPIPGDSSRIEHVTHHPDSTRVSAAASWVKTVRFVNEGSVDWPVRQICRVGAHDDPREIQSPRCIALPPLRSGDSTDVTIPLQAPEVVARGGEWKLARFKMVDGDMRQVFPGKSALRADARVRR